MRALCARDHMTHGKHLDSCSTEGCTGCLPAVAKTGTMLCGSCTARIYWRLDEIPELIAHMRSRIVPGSPQGWEPRVSSSREAPLPVRTKPLEDADDLIDIVSTWVSRFAPQHDDAVRVVEVLGNPGRFPAGTEPEAAYTLARTLTRWLQRNERLLVASSDAADYHDEIADSVAVYRRRYRMTKEGPRRYQKRVCPVCGEPRIEVTWPRPDEDPELMAVSCAHCGHGFEAGDVQRAIEHALMEGASA